MLTLCLAIVLSTLAFGTVHSWSLAIFQVGAGLVLVLWMVDAWRSRALRISRNVLQLPLIGLLILGLFQLLLSGGAAESGLTVEPLQRLTLDPYTTRFVLMQILSLFIYFAAALAFTDSPRRLRLLVRTIIVFGFLLAVFGLMQKFIDPVKIYGVREATQSVPFGPYVNRHHFAGYMELTLALPLGVLFSGAVDINQRLLYAFAAALMGIALIITDSRGGMLSLGAELVFLVVVSGVRRKGEKEAENEEEKRPRRIRAAVVRVALAFGLVIALVVGVLFFGGEESLNRLLGTASMEDPTTGRAHFWSVTLNIIRDNPLIGTGLGAFSVAYTRYDTRSGFLRLEQAHNDYLQVLSDAGIVGAALGLFFIIALFRMGFARASTNDKFRRGVAIGALAGCFAVLVHSFFDFTLHTTANALLFLVLAGLATIDGRVEQAVDTSGRRRRKKRRRVVTQPGHSHKQVRSTGAPAALGQ